GTPQRNSTGDRARSSSGTRKNGGSLGAPIFVSPPTPEGVRDPTRALPSALAMRGACGCWRPAFQPAREEEVSMPAASPGAARIPPSPGQEPAVRRPGCCACANEQKGKGTKKWAHPQVDPFGGVFAYELMVIRSDL